MADLTQTEVKRLFHYNPDTGVLTRRISAGPAKAGSKAGHLDSHGYLQVRAGNKKKYLVHRIIWLHVYGYWPGLLDHINRDKTDNRIANLREVSMSENLLNTNLRKNNTSGVKGVHFDIHTRRWRAQFRGKPVGSSPNKEIAIKMRREAEDKFAKH